MAGPHRAVALALALAVCESAAAAQAQSLRTLHVDVLEMHADRQQLHVGDVFHLAIHAHVREAVQALDELVIPDVGTMQMLGDERRVTHGRGGTDVIETLTLEPTAAGPYTFAGAYLDAIDARTHKPSRFSAPPVRVVVMSPVPSPEDFWRLMRRIGALALIVLAVIAGAVALAALVRARRRRERPVVQVPRPVTPPPPPPRSPRDAVAEALRAYRVAPADGALARLRAALLAAAGTNPGATLRDALAATPDHGLRGALIAAERAAFGPAYARDAASVELVDSTEAWLSGNGTRRSDEPA